MTLSRYEEHRCAPAGVGALPTGAAIADAGGAACGDLVRVGVALDGGRCLRVGALLDGCGPLTAAASALHALVDHRPLLEAARVGPAEIAAELGGLLPASRHAAELVADAFHGALGAAAAAGAALEADPGRTLVAMSGGVDSAVAALRCGPAAVAVTLELWRDPENDAEGSCCSASAVRRARGLAHRMGLPHLTLDLRDAFRAGVVDPWIAGHREGRTPNPCSACNGRVRIAPMVELADRLGAAALATGHYARLTPDGLLRPGASGAKDQSYALARLPADVLARMRFPLGELEKPRVRELAAEAGLPVAAAPDSQDLCFLAGTGRARFLARHGDLEARPGPVVDDATGAVLGAHDGVAGFTVGQRRGLGIAAREPRYVVGVDAERAEVRVGPRAALAVTDVGLRDVVLHRPAHVVTAVRLRYRQAPVPARVREALGPGAHPAASLVLERPELGVAPGQTAVLHAGDAIVGSAEIAVPRPTEEGAGRPGGAAGPTPALAAG